MNFGCKPVFFDYPEKINFDGEVREYQLFLQDIRTQVKIQGVYLYTLARPSLQPEAQVIAPVPGYLLDRVADSIRRIGFKVQVSY